MSFLLRPRWLAFHAVCLIAVVVMASLSFWQFRRLDERQTFNDLVRSRSTQAVIPIEQLDPIDPPDAAWKRVGASGTYLNESSILILNRSQGGRAGVNVATPLRLTDGRVVIVVRGFLPLDESVPVPPSGNVRVVGTVRTSEIRRAGQPTESPEETKEFFRLDIDRIAGRIDGQVLPVAISLEISDPPENAVLQPVASPELSDGPHLPYAGQWLICATAVIVGWALAVRRSYLTNAR
ncbi:MAG: SURF1 family protein [Ilumatobacteraceae bacterium]